MTKKKKGRSSGGVSSKSAKKKHALAGRRRLAEEAVMRFAGVDRLTPGLVDLHCHSTCSDGHFSPELVVEKAYRNGVRVLALTDHDTMAGVPAAVRAAKHYGMRLIPGVEMSAKYLRRKTSRREAYGESVHILAYYGVCGPSNCDQLEEKLAGVREGRYKRAMEMVRKLKMLNKPVQWENVLRIAGDGVAPGRPHIARALYEAGHVENVGQAFTKYLHDDGPAYATGAELMAAEAVALIHETGGFAVLAHPWSLKDPLSVIEHLANAGLDGMEVFRSDGKSAEFGPLAEVNGLVKVGGSDFHGRGDPEELTLGAIELPPTVVHEFLKTASSTWNSAIERILQDFVQSTLPDEEGRYQHALDVGKGDISICKIEVPGEDRTTSCIRLSAWLSDKERESVEDMAGKLGLKTLCLDVEGKKIIGAYGP